MRRRVFIQQALKLLVLTSPVLSFAQQVRAKASALINRLKRISQWFYFPGSKEFESLKKVVNLSIQPQDPTAILQTQDLREIQTTIVTGHSVQLPIRMRSAGHCFEDFSMGDGLVIDVRKLKLISIEKSRAWVKAGAGLTLDELRYFLDQNAYTFPTGSCPSVGIAGYLLGGGHSQRSRLLGLGADRVQAMDVILASGEQVFISPNNLPDLFWAMLGGGGGNFAVVTNFYLDLIPKTSDISFHINTGRKKFSEIFSAWEEFLAHGPNEISMVLSFTTRRGKILRANLSGFLLGNYSPSTRAVEEFKRLIPKKLWQHFKIQENHFRIVSEYRPLPSDHKAETHFKGTSHYADQKIGRDGFQQIQSDLFETCRRSNFGRIEFFPMGGKILLPARDISYPHRNSLYSVALFSYIKDPSLLERDKQNLSRLRQQIEPLFSGRHYVNYPDLDLPLSPGLSWGQKYYGESLNDLLLIKKKYDPQNVFRFGKHSLSALIG